MSPLGTGYGDLSLSVFLELVAQESAAIESSPIEHLIVCCDSAPTFKELVEAASASSKDWANQGAPTAFPNFSSGFEA